MSAKKDPELYRKMSAPFPDAETANTALGAFFEEVYALREKHRIANVHVIASIAILDAEGKLTDATIVVLELIAKHNAILGTAHLSLAEITPLVKEARQRGVQKILLTHPFFRVPAGMNEQFLLEMAALGVIAEFGFCTVSPMWAYATVEQTKHAMDTIGYNNCVIMSDAGQTHNPIAPEAMRLYAQCLYEKGVKASDLELLMTRTPSALLGI